MPMYCLMTGVASCVGCVSTARARGRAMVRSVFFLAAQDIHSGPSLNDCSVQRILEAIPVPAFPAQLDALPLVCLLKRDPTDAAQSTCRLTLTVDQVVLAQCSFDVDFGNCSIASRFT